MNIKRMTGVLATALLCGAAAVAQAAAFPERPVLMVVAGNPGGGLDLTGRAIENAIHVMDKAAQVRNPKVDQRLLREIETRGVIITAPGDQPGVDFISRFFAPAVGVDEDPVTGSAHCALAPYWADRLGKRTLVGYQASPRGGTVRVEHAGDRVRLSGQAVTVVKGTLA